MHIKGITVTLHEKTQTGSDAFGVPIYTEIPAKIDNVLVAPVSGDEIINDLDLYGKKAVYQLGIPKGDAHNWEDSIVEFFGQSFKTYGPALEGIDDMIPLAWNKKIKVEAIK